MYGPYDPPWRIWPHNYEPEIEVTCGLHGPMKYRDGAYWFQCVGFDGEGCCEITIEDIARLGDGFPLEHRSHLLPIIWKRTLIGNLSRICVKYKPEPGSE